MRYAGVDDFTKELLTAFYKILLTLSQEIPWLVVVLTYVVDAWKRRRYLGDLRTYFKILKTYRN